MEREERLRVSFTPLPLDQWVPFIHTFRLGPDLFPLTDGQVEITVAGIKEGKPDTTGPQVSAQFPLWGVNSGSGGITQSENDQILRECSRSHRDQ